MELSKKILITIGREEGSGGRAVAEALGKDLNIPVFDKNMFIVAVNGVFRIKIIYLACVPESYADDFSHCSSP